MEELRIADLPPALYDRPVGNMPCYSLREATKFWQPAWTEDFTYGRLKVLAERGFIHQRRRRGSGRTSTAEFGADDFAAASALMAFYDTGISDVQIVGAASLALYSWDRVLNPPPGDGHPYPLAAAFLGILNRREFWTVRVSTFFHAETGERRLLSACLPDDKQFGGALDPIYIPRTTLTVLLPPLFLPFARAFKR